MEEGSHSGRSLQLPPPCRGGKICLSDHFKPLWARNVPKFGLAHLMALGVSGKGGRGEVPSVSHPPRIEGGGDPGGRSLCPHSWVRGWRWRSPTSWPKASFSTRRSERRSWGGGFPLPPRRCCSPPLPSPSICAPSPFPINCAALTLPLCCSGGPNAREEPSGVWGLSSPDPPNTHEPREARLYNNAPKSGTVSLSSLCAAAPLRAEGAVPPKAERAVPRGAEGAGLGAMSP